jgi:hypothetical protein
MRPSNNRVSTAWTFAAGALFGSLAVLTPIAVSGTSPAKANATKVRHSVVAARDSSLASQDQLISPAAGRSEPVRPADAASRKPQPHPPASPGRTTRHSELDLQLD